MHGLHRYGVDGGVDGGVGGAEGGAVYNVCAWKQQDKTPSQDVPEGFWEDVPPVPDSRDLQGEEAELRALCHAGQRALVSTPSADIDQLADDLMDMEECEAAFDDLDLHDGIC